MPCAETGTTTPVSGTPAGGTTPPATTAPAPPTGPATLDLKVTAPKLSARKLFKRRAFAVRLQAGERITGLSAKLRKGKATLGSGKLAAVGPGVGTLKVKLTRKAAKRLKKGTYQLSFSGTKSDGRTASGAVSLRVAK